MCGNPWNSVLPCAPKAKTAVTKHKNFAARVRALISSPHGLKTPPQLNLDPNVDLPHDCQTAVLFQLDDTIDAPLPRSSSSCAAFAVSMSQAEQALVDGVQCVLKHPDTVCSDLMRLDADLRSNHGSFTRSLFDLMSESARARVRRATLAQFCTTEILCVPCVPPTPSVRETYAGTACAPCAGQSLWQPPSATLQHPKFPRETTTLALLY